MAVGNYVAPPADHAVAVWSNDADAANAILQRFRGTLSKRQHGVIVV